MDEILIARVLFGFTASVHYLFVAITLGLTPLIATIATFRGDIGRSGVLGVITRIYVANYALGIVTGLVMELQMSLLWTGPGTADYAPIAGMVALETVVAFFLESTLLGLWLAGRSVLPAWAQAVLFWGITVTAYVSAIFITTANSYLHYPLGEGALSPSDFFSLLLRPAALWPILHVTATSLVVGAFLCAALGAIRCRKDDTETGRRLIRMGIGVAAVCSPIMAISGFVQFATVRPAGAGSDESALTGVLLGAMVLGGLIVTVLTWFVMVPLSFTRAIYRARWLRAVVIAGVFVPVLLTLCGWISRETARQPWFIVGRVTIDSAASAIPDPALLIASIAFVVLPLAAVVVALVVYRRIAQRIPVPQADPGEVPS